MGVCVITLCCPCSFYFTDTIIHACVDIEGELSEAEGYVKAMEVLGSTPSVRSTDNSVQEKAADYRDEFQQLQGKYRNMKSLAEAQAIKGTSAGRSKQLSLHQTMDKSTLLLEQSRLLAQDASATGDMVLTDLEAQKSQLAQAHQRVNDTKDVTFDAKNILRQMGFRAIRQKLILYVVILALFGIICLIFYYGVIGGRKSV